MNRRVLLVPVVLVLSGCEGLEFGESATGERPGEVWSSVRLPNTTRDAAFEAGLYALKQWFRVAEASPETGVIRSVTTEYDQKGGTGRFRDAALGFKNRMRRTATLVVRESGSACIARCAVRVERLDTADHRVFRDNQRFDDYPSETPIDTDAGVSAGQNQAWTEMSRDRELEGEILSVLRSRLEGKSPAAPAEKS